MKKILFIFAFMLTVVASSFAQKMEKPTINKEVTAVVASMDDEGTVYTNVTVKLKCTVKISAKMQTKITIYNEAGKKIAKKTLPNALLYVYDNGQIQVGKDGFSEALIYTDKNGAVLGKIRQTEGVVIVKQ